jgi:hypothetical protein
LLATAGVRLSLKGTTIANHSYVDVGDIGANETGLLCHTNKTDCCGVLPNRAGEWYFSSGTRVENMAVSQVEFYRNRGMQVVRLNHRERTSKQRGRYRCEIPDANSNMQSIYAYIGMPTP